MVSVWDSYSSNRSTLQHHVVNSSYFKCISPLVKWRDHHELETGCSFFSWLPPKHCSLSLLHSKTRIEAAKWHLTSPMGLQADVSPPWDETAGGPPQQSNQCLDQFMTPTKQDCTVSKRLSHGHTPVFPAYNHDHIFYFHCLLHRHSFLFPLALWLLLFSIAITLPLSFRLLIMHLFCSHSEAAWDTNVFSHDFLKQLLTMVKEFLTAKTRHLKTQNLFHTCLTLNQTKPVTF